jgi:periplasmic protein TonB
MNANQILSADLLDLIFSDRNKAYGAYQLRKSYDLRIKKALGITSLVLLLGIGGHLMARSSRSEDKPKFKITTVDPFRLPPVDEPPPPPPPPPAVEPPPPVRTIQWTTPVIVDEPDVIPPSIDDVEDARISNITTEGIDDDGIVAPSTIDGGTNVIEKQVEKEPDIWIGPVQMEAVFKGDWVRFLERNLNGNVPVDNGAPAGKYAVLIQFVVDTEGKISDITAISNNGYGMEDEAIRVLKKANKWDPAIQNGRQVKTYKRQLITFKIDE